MMKRIGLMAAGVTAGLILTVVLLEKERRDAENSAGHSSVKEEKRDGLFAEICGNTVKMYKVKDGSFCGYSETKTFESHEAAMEWVAKETDAKMIISDT